MSKENFVNFLKAAASDGALIEQIWNTVNVGDLKSLAAERGFDVGDISDDDIKRTFGIVTGAIAAEELSDEELDMVAAGAGFKDKLSQAMTELDRRPEGPGFYEGWPTHGW